MLNPTKQANQDLRPRPGIWLNEKGGFDVSLFAPKCKVASLVLDNSKKHLPLTSNSHGYFTGHLIQLKHGDRYWFKTDARGEPIPDPASLSQPDGVHQASEIFDFRQNRVDAAQWKGLPIDDMIIYELHIGTFTAEGTFGAAIQHLPALAELGITSLELMPVNSFPGTRNWGYDGVYWQAAQSSYGGPTELLQFIDAAHEQGLAVIIDTVFNHLGPEGNYLGLYASYLNEAKPTPWGPAVNVDGPYSDGVRDFVLSVAKTWLVDFGADGLRLDAVHALPDTSAQHILEALSSKVDQWSEELGRPLTLIAECDLNAPKYVQPLAQGGLGLHAQWIDEFHHAARSLLTGETRSYYGDFGQEAHLLSALQTGYVYTGQYSAHRQRSFGLAPDGLLSHQLVVFGQNHDQVGNRAMGERLHEHLNHQQYLLMAALYLWSPFTPMLWMGEEYRESAPFPFFVDHRDAHILEATRKGRAHEFAGFLSEGQSVPDPGSPDTFQSAKLSHQREGEVYEFYRKAIQTRKALWPSRERSLKAHSVKLLSQGVFLWQMPREDGKMITVMANTRDKPFSLQHDLLPTQLAMQGPDCASIAMQGEQLPGFGAAVWLLSA